MKILQFTSDWKWTGPAEPMLRLALALRERGHEVAIACPDPPEPERRSLASELAAADLPRGFALERGRGLSMARDRREARRLRRWLGRERPEIVHCWHSRDHLIALAARGPRFGRRSPSLVRSFRSADPPAAWPWNRWLFGPGTDGLVLPSPGSVRRFRRLRGARPALGCFGAVDLRRFAPALPDPQLRRDLGVAPEARVVGIVARVQPHRRFDLLLAAALRLFARLPEARLLVVGRGTHRERVAERPALELGIADRVIFAGYRKDDYPDVLRTIDVLTFLVPGSDGTCRAVLEAAACGIPAVTTRRGALAEIVRDGETGLVVNEEPEALASAWEALLRDPRRRAAMGAAARARAEREFAPDRLAARVEDFYRELLALRRR